MHAVAGARVAADASIPLSGRESTEAPQLDPVAARQSRCDLAEDDGDDIIQIARFEVRVGLRESLSEFRPGHPEGQSCAAANRAKLSNAGGPVQPASTLGGVGL